MFQYSKNVLFNRFLGRNRLRLTPHFHVLSVLSSSLSQL